MKHWYKKSIIYSLDVEAYRDGNGDGIGDFQGLGKSLPYLSSLGIDCIWLLPVFDTPNRDNGYDVRDYLSIDRRLGDLASYTDFMDIANQYNIRIIIDMVVNHCSDEHPWFQEALKGPDNPFYDYYIWTEEKPEGFVPIIAFGGQQSGNWEYVESINKYYYHSFYKFQPNLNLANPKVRNEVKRIMRFWLQLGVSGFRMDAVTFMINKKHEGQEFVITPHQVLMELREFVEEHTPHAVLLAEADVEPEEYGHFFSEDREMHMMFNFYGNNYLFYSLATEKATPLVESFKKLPTPVGNGQYVNFIRNHDELNLEKLSDEEMQKVFERFASEENMRIFGRGIRRRFNSMVDGDRKMLELGYSLLFSLPGTPVLRFGQEIGMGDELSLFGRNSVRTAMQWSNDKNGGFSSAPTESLARPVIQKPPYGFEEINVNKQIKDKNSLLNWMSMAITARRRTPEFGIGRYEFLNSNDDYIMIHICRHSDTAAIAVHNFGNEKKKVKLDVELELAKQLIDIFGDEPYQDLEPQTREIEINPKGYRWFRTGF